ncbi:MAG: enoyl-CoA hydratase/isomerase family protein [Myxococcota bacterium]
MSSERIRVQRDGVILVVTIDNPAKLNTYDGPMLKAIAQAWADLDADPELRAGVLTGAGQRAFCAGADIHAVASGGFSDPPYPELAENLSRKPLLAAIEGLCLGGGMMFATGCDLRIAGESAEFGLPEARWNLPAHWLGALARQMLPSHVLELALWADQRLGAVRLYEMGWLTRVVPTGRALSEALIWAQRVAQMAPAAVRAFKELTRAAWTLPPADALALGREQTADLIAMEDAREGPAAFAEGRPPRFRDR